MVLVSVLVAGAATEERGVELADSIKQVEKKGRREIHLNSTNNGLTNCMTCVSALKMPFSAHNYQLIRGINVENT
jgi:hypothetical protein